eukprot:UN23839
MDKDDTLYYKNAKGKIRAEVVKGSRYYEITFLGLDPKVFQFVLNFLDNLECYGYSPAMTYERVTGQLEKVNLLEMLFVNGQITQFRKSYHENLLKEPFCSLRNRLTLLNGLPLIFKEFDAPENVQLATVFLTKWFNFDIISLDYSVGYLMDRGQYLYVFWQFGTLENYPIYYNQQEELLLYDTGDNTWKIVPGQLHK